MGVSAGTCQLGKREYGARGEAVSACRGIFLGYDPTTEPTTLAERLKAKRRALGVTFEQVATYLGWDPASLTRYLNGSWRLSPDRALALNTFLNIDEITAETVRELPRRRR
jgi:cyanate lyase